MYHLILKLFIFEGILQVLKFEFLRFKILNILNFESCEYIAKSLMQVDTNYNKAEVNSVFEKHIILVG